MGVQGPAYYDPPSGGLSYFGDLTYDPYPFVASSSCVPSPSNPDPACPNPNQGVNRNCPWGNCPPLPYFVSDDGITLSFVDAPADCCNLSDGGNFIAFQTTLVGISSQGSTSCGEGGPPYCTNLLSWTWNSTFNGTAGGVHQTASIYPIDPGSGTGGVTVTSINGVQLPPAVVPSQIAITASGLAYSRVTKTFNGTVTIQNVSSSPINGPFQIVFFGLTSKVTLANETGDLSGTPYLTVPGVGNLGPGQKATVKVEFSDPSDAPINPTPVIYAGSMN